MGKISLPNNWEPRDYQMPSWKYLEAGGRHLELIWARRSGKDDVALNWAAVAAHQRIGNYWHMLPKASQARKAIWTAINPRTGRRRIDDAFPLKIRAQTLENEMFIRFKSGATWQVLGSDNYDAMVGSPPIGITYSEWALANPSVRGYLRPIIIENGGWQIFITTPRGRNHAHKTYLAGIKEKYTFAQLLTVRDTGAMTEAQIQAELREYVSVYGPDQGKALFEQELLCSFDAAVLGAFYGHEMKAAQEEGRIGSVPHNPDLPVYTAWDIGRRDDTSIWFFQVEGNRIRVLESISESLKDPDFFCSEILGKQVTINFIDGQLQVKLGEDYPHLAHRRQYKYAKHYLPHDARAKTFAAKGKSVIEQLIAVFGKPYMQIVTELSFQDGIQAARKAINQAEFDEERNELGVSALSSYQRLWDTEKRMFSDTHLHDWSSNLADAWRMLGIMWQSVPAKVPDEPPAYAKQIDKGFTLTEMWEVEKNSRPTGAASRRI